MALKNVATIHFVSPTTVPVYVRGLQREQREYLLATHAVRVEYDPGLGVFYVHGAGEMSAVPGAPPPSAVHCVHVSRVQRWTEYGPGQAPWEAKSAEAPKKPEKAA